MLDPAHFLAILAGMAVLPPLLALILRTRLNRRTLHVLAASGPVILVSWFVYGAIMDRLGLDSLLGMLVCAAMFGAVGAMAGIYLSGAQR